MKTINKLSLLAGALSVVAIVFSAHSPAIAQYDGNGVTITFKRPTLPPGMPDVYKKWWFEHTFPVGEYEVNVNSSWAFSLEFRLANPSPDAVFLSGKEAIAVVNSGYTAEICGERIVYKKYICLPIENARKNKLDIFAKVKAVKVKKDRLTNAVTVWENRDFTGRARDLGVETHNSNDFYFFSSNSAGYNSSRPPNAVWVPAGYWVMFCMEGLSDDRKLCGPGRGKQGKTFFNDSPIQRAILRGSQMPYEYKYALVGKGQPPPEFKPLIIIKDPNSDIKKSPKSFPKPKQLPKSKKLP